MKTWLWPNRTISKTESAQLREEHNATVNTAHELLTALQAMLDMFDNSDTSHAFTKRGEQSAYIAAIQMARRTTRKVGPTPAEWDAICKNAREGFAAARSGYDCFGKKID